MLRGGEKGIKISSKLPEKMFGARERLSIGEN
jgi:hypothetical protein